MTAVDHALDASAEAWARSGAMALSGPPPGGTTGPPARLLDGVEALGRRIEQASGRLGHALGWDWPALLGERAALGGLGAGGRISCGGATRLLSCRDGWVAVSLARPSDHDLVPAWLALAGADPAAGDDLERALAGCDGAALAAAAELVGLPVGVLGERQPDATGGVAHTRFGVRPRSRHVRVLDLTALWAGPLCGSILAAAGAEVTKVEAADRPDAARAGSPDLDRLLNHRKARLGIDLAAPRGAAVLARLVGEADVVVESARPRALEQLGIVAEREMARPDGPQVWLRITGHGRASNRVAFGDDAAVAGGLVVHDDDGPWFCGDAIADPLCGLATAAAVLDALVDGERALVDVAMAAVAAAHAGPTLARPPGACAAPRARPRP